MKHTRWWGRAALWAIAGPALATLAGLGIGSRRATAAALVYLLGVLAVATAGGLWPGLVASVVSFVGLNYFFTPPRHTLSVSKTDDLIALLVFVLVGAVVSTLVARGTAQRERAERRESETRGLYDISSGLLRGARIEEVLAELASTVRTMLGLVGCSVQVPDADGELRTHVSEGDVSSSDRVEIPMSTRDGSLGVLMLYPGPRKLDEGSLRLASIFAQQAAAMLERGDLEREARAARVDAETNKVRRALLSAVSHDFRTPLSSIKAALTSLVPDGGPPPAEADREELFRTALEETERLERIVTNLLDLTRIRSGAIAPDLRPTPVDELLEDTLAPLRPRMIPHQVVINVRPDLPRVDADPVQVEQVLRNVLENAAKFSPPKSEIRISAASWQGRVEIRIADRGPGIAPGDRSAVFDEFYRANDARAAGTGLGLAVAKAIVVAHSGEIWVEDTPGGGATIVVALPVARVPA